MWPNPQFSADLVTFTEETRSVGTSDVISALFLWKKVTRDVIILKHDPIKVLLLAVSGYR